MAPVLAPLEQTAVLEAGEVPAGATRRQMCGAGDLSCCQFTATKHLEDRQPRWIAENTEEPRLSGDIGPWSRLQHASNDVLIFSGLQMTFAEHNHNIDTAIRADG